MTFEQWWKTYKTWSHPQMDQAFRKIASDAWYAANYAAQSNPEPQRLIPAGFTGNEVVAGVECPRCGAQKDVRCISSTGKPGLVYPHQARRKAFLQSRQQKG